MYKFTNGIVVFDEKTRDDFIKAGYKLVEEEKIEEDKSKDENTSNNGTIEEKPRGSKKVSK
jgi:hypothetical protein|nr:MAG TPA: hypothetical protein [Bacteriophage sp.]